MCWILYIKFPLSENFLCFDFNIYFFFLVYACVCMYSQNYFGISQIIENERSHELCECLGLPRCYVGEENARCEWGEWGELQPREVNSQVGADC